MKKIPALLAVITLLFMKLPTAAQEAEPVLASVTYEFIHVYDTSKRDKPIREEMILFLGQNSSKYVNLKLWGRPIKSVNAPPANSGNTIVVTAIPVATVYGWGATQETLFQHIKENKLNKVASLSTANYLIELPLPKIDWKIDAATRSIGGYTCQKAIGDYAGRTYTAWFTPDLPFRNGPWKLSGLPGLILEARDAKNEVLFLFKEFSKDNADQNTGAWHKRLVKVEEKAFIRASEAYLNDPVGVSQSQHPAGSRVPLLGYKDSTGKFYTGEQASALFEKYRKERLAPGYNPLELIKQ
jgi:GLPGLI family protein